MVWCVEVYSCYKHRNIWSGYGVNNVGYRCSFFWLLWMLEMRVLYVWFRNGLARGEELLLSSVFVTHTIFVISIRQAKSKMDKFVQKCPGHPDKREYALPYYLLHNEGDSVYGTVIIFHGFSATTTQMSLLAQYLYENGFNVYQPALCGHYFNKPDQYWPKVHF